MSQSTKINFRLEPDQDGYPPVSVESVWAQVSGSSYLIDNVPFFARSATVGDRVSAMADSEGVLWFDTLESASSNSLLRAVVFNVELLDEIGDELVKRGCSVEKMRNYKLIAIDVPIDVKLSDIQDFLAAEALNGKLDFEEAILRQ